MFVLNSPSVALSHVILVLNPLSCEPRSHCTAFKNTVERVNILIIEPSVRAITPTRRYCCLIGYVGAYLATILSVSPSLHARVLHKRDASSVDVMQTDRPR